MFYPLQQEEIKEWVKNGLAFATSLLCIIGLLTNMKEIIMVYFVGIYCIIDVLFFKCKNDIIIHHIFVWIFIGSFFMFPLEKESLTKYVRVLLWAETSSIFLIIRLYYKNIYNDLLLFISFFYFRIWFLGKEIVLNIHFWNWVKDAVVTMNSINGYISILCVYGFYWIQLYWFSILLKKIYKMMLRLSGISHEICFLIVISFIKTCLFITVLFYYVIWLWNSFIYLVGCKGWNEAK
jgi:hypothetical protein